MLKLLILISAIVIATLVALYFLFKKLEKDVIKMYKKPIVRVLTLLAVICTFGLWDNDQNNEQKEN